MHFRYLPIYLGSRCVCCAGMRLHHPFELFIASQWVHKKFLVSVEAAPIWTTSSAIPYCMFHMCRGSLPTEPTCNSSLEP